MDTAHATPDDPRPLGADLRRSADDRIVLGLCAGIARATGISPLAARLATALAALLLLPLVLLAYTVTAVLVPRDDGSALIGQGTRDRRDVWVALGLTLLAAPVALSAGDGALSASSGAHLLFALPPLLTLTLLAVVGVLGIASVRSRRHGAPTPTATPADASGAPSADTAVTTAFATPAATAGPAGADQATGDTVVMPATPPADAAPDAAPTPNPAPTFTRTPQTGRQERERRGLTLPVLGAVAAVPALFALLLATGAVDASATSWAIMLATMAVVAAAGAVAIAVLRPSYLGPGLLVLLAAGLGITSIGVSQLGGILDDGVGQRAYRVTDPASLRTPFTLGAGELDVDLRALRLAPRERVTVHARLGFGQLTIAVPRGTRVTTTRASNVPQLDTTARENGASATRSAAAPTIILDLRAKGINVRTVTGDGRRLVSLDTLAESDLGFWNGTRSDAPFTPGTVGSLLARYRG